MALHNNISTHQTLLNATPSPSSVSGRSLQPGLSPQQTQHEREEAAPGGDTAGPRLTPAGDDTRSGCSDDSSRSAVDAAALLPFQFPKKRGRKSKKLLEAM